MKKLDCVLLVDDDEIASFLNESLIQEEGLSQQILQAKNGREALEVINRCHCLGKSYPDLVLLDINMPVMNGFEFLQAYQRLDTELDPSPVIVVLTSSQNNEDLSKAEAAGVQMFLEKPLTVAKLSTVLEQCF